MCVYRCVRDGVCVHMCGGVCKGFIGGEGLC